mmetsp:Transcript_11253/g.33303  ORF Transcript_11253/g.33303 Transcript_11253/m.33303 type:complete len:251 (-) Transcript_11253:465-1217(-)
MRTSFSRISSSCFRLYVRCCEADASAWASSFVASASPMSRFFSASACMRACSKPMSALTRIASASDSALAMACTRSLSRSIFVRESSACRSCFRTWLFVPASISAVLVSSDSLIMRCSWLISARLFLPCSLTMTCSFLRLTSFSVSSDLRVTSPMRYSCSRWVLSMALRRSKVFSRLIASDCGRKTSVMLQPLKETPQSLNLLFRCASNLSALLPRMVFTDCCDWALTMILMPSSMAPDRSWSKCTAPSL